MKNSLWQGRHCYLLINSTLFGITLVLGSCNYGSNSTTSSNSWQVVGTRSSLPNVVLNSLLVSNSGVIYAGGSIDVYNGGVEQLSLASNNTWQIVGGAYIPNHYIANYGTNIKQVNGLALSDNNIVYAAVNENYLYGAVYFSVNNSWQVFIDSITPDSGKINSLVAAQDGSAVYVATSAYDVVNNRYLGHVYSGESGGSWQQIGGGGMPDSGVANAVLLNANTLYVAAGGPNLAMVNTTIGDVYSSTFTGGSWGNWSQVGSASMPDSGVATALALVNLKDTAHLYSSTSKGNVYLNQNKGVAWSLIGNGSMPDAGAVNALAASANGSTALIYAATSKGNVYATMESGVWQLLGGGATPDGWFINSIATYHNQVYVATQGGNVYTTQASF